MHAFVDDGKQLVFFDAFGLTRVQLPKKVKTDRKVSGTWMCANGALALLHSQRTNTRTGRALPALKSVKIEGSYDLSYGAAAVLPDGASAMTLGHDGNVTVVAVPGAKKLWAASLANGAKAVTGAVDLGALLPKNGWERAIFIGADGAMVALNPHAGGLFGARIDGESLADPWHVPLGSAPQGVLVCTPSIDETFIASFHAKTQQACCVVVDAKHNARSRALDALAPPAFSGGRVVRQTELGVIVRESFAGGAVEKFALPEGTHGVGEVCATGDAIYFITADRNRIVDVKTGDVVERQLPEEEAQLRADYLAFLARFDGSRRASNTTISLAAMDPPAYGAGHRPNWSWNSGDQSLLHYLVVGNFIARARREESPKYSPGSWSYTSELRKHDVDDVAAALRTLETHELSLIDGLSLCSSPLGESWLERTPETERGPRLTSDAARLLLRAIAESLHARGRVSFATEIDAWQREPLDARHFIDMFDPSVERDGWFDAQSAALWAVLAAFGPESAPVFVDWLVARKSGFVVGNSHIARDAVEAMLRSFPETKSVWESAQR
jgi:hypothetical protein